MIKLKVILILIVIVFGGIAPVGAVTKSALQSQFFEMNKAYQNGQYDQAIALGNAILEQGLVSDNVYYNLGNAHFKNKAYSFALVQYLRALKINPSHKDALINAQLTKEFLNQSVPKVETKKIKVLQKLDHWIQRTSYDHLKRWALLFLFFSGVFFIWGYWKRIPYMYLILGSCIFLMGWLFFSSMHEQRWSQEKDRAICIQTTDAKFEPLEQATVYFQLSEGTDIKILRQTYDWSKIKRSDGKVGWVLSKTLEVL